MLSGAVRSVERRPIAQLAPTHRSPVIAGDKEFAQAGALLTYGADRSAIYRRAAYYVDACCRRCLKVR